MGCTYTVPQVEKLFFFELPDARLGPFTPRKTSVTIPATSGQASRYVTVESAWTFVISTCLSLPDPAADRGSLPKIDRTNTQYVVQGAVWYIAYATYCSTFRAAKTILYLSVQGE